MTLYYGIAAVLTLISIVLIVRPLLKGRGAAPSRAALDAQLYRDQLDEVERDLARGTIGAAEAEGARAEVSRRLLAANAEAETVGEASHAPNTANGLVAGLALIGTPALAVLVYLYGGMPGQPDLPLAERLAAAAAEARPSQAQAEAEIEPETPEPTTREQKDYVALIGQLEALLERRPNPGDARGLEFLANGYVQLGRHREAWRTYQRLIEVSGEHASAEVYGAMAQAMVMAADGYVSPEAERAIGTAIALDPSLPIVRYYAGLAAAQGGRMGEAISIWQRLRTESPADAPWLPFLDELLAEARGTGGSAATAPGPSSADVEAAAEMSPEERQQMIEGMVQRLEDRLTSEGGEVEEWLRLITSYDRLGRRDDAARVARQGIESFGSSTEADFLREQSLLMGVLTE